MLGQLLKLFGKAVYLGLAAWLPLMLALEKGLLEPAQAPAQLVNILFFLSCVVGPMQDSAVFGVTQQKYIALKYMKMPPRRYVYADLIMRYVPFFLYFLPVLLVAFLLVDGSVWQALGSFVMLFSFRFLGEAVQVWYYEKKETVLSRKVGLVWLLIGISLVGAYLPILLRVELPTMWILFSIPGVIAMLLIGAGSFYYVIWGYRGYETAFLRSVDQKFLLSSMVQESKSSAFSDVAVKEQDLKTDQKEVGRLVHLQATPISMPCFCAAPPPTGKTRENPAASDPCGVSGRACLCLSRPGKSTAGSGADRFLSSVFCFHHVFYVRSR